MRSLRHWRWDPLIALTKVSQSSAFASSGVVSCASDPQTAPMQIRQERYLWRFEYSVRSLCRIDGGFPNRSIVSGSEGRRIFILEHHGLPKPYFGRSYIRYHATTHRSSIMTVIRTTPKQRNSFDPATSVSFHSFGGTRGHCIIMIASANI